MVQHKYFHTIPQVEILVEVGTGSFGVINVGGGVFTSIIISGVSSYTDLTNVPSGIISGSGQLPHHNYRVESLVVVPNYQVES